MRSEVLLVDDDEHVRAAYAQALELNGINVSVMPSAAGVLDREQVPFAAIVQVTAANTISWLAVLLKVGIGGL